VSCDSTPLSRRRFLAGAAAVAATWPLRTAAQGASGPRTIFRHGVASGDPLPDRIILWTRVTPPDAGTTTAIEVRWLIAEDERLERVASRGTASAAAERDYTVKIDAAGLRPGRPYYFAFEAGRERSPIGRTRTAPAGRVNRMQLGIVSCANYPAGFFNVYRCLAGRDDLDAVVHLGDYIYEFANAVYGDGTQSHRIPDPPGEAVTLADYRLRYAAYRSDVDLQEVHQRHPFIVVWDDHESANNAWSGGAEAHTADKGDWRTRQREAYRAYSEWMPVREQNGAGIHLYRTFKFGDLADLVMLDTRGLRDRQADRNDPAAIAHPSRTMLGAAQEAWLFDALRASKKSGSVWRLLGQQVMFAPITPPGFRVQNIDAWDGYPAARSRIMDFLEREGIADLAVLTGDIHSSWANDLPRNPFGGYQPATGSGSMAVELVTPAVSSPPLFSIEGVREAAPLLRLALQHIKYLDGESRGYVLLEVTPSRLTADWYHVATVAERSDRERRATRFVCERGSSRLQPG
jgi:alkaline phosphatase D